MTAHIPVQAAIARMDALTADTTLFTLRTDSEHPVAKAFLPGQFLQLSLPGIGEVPISYCGSPSGDGSIKLCIRHVGRVTTALRSLTPGGAVAVRGPFGRGFPMAAYAGCDMLLVAGGLGMAPVRSLLLALLKQRDAFGRITLLYGAREPSALLFLEELLKLKDLSVLHLLLAVDHHGSCSDELPGCRIALLPELLGQLAVDAKRTCAAVCGPPAAYPHLVTGLRRLGLGDDRIHLSLERRMKCGIGLCGHCAVGTRLCCIDGPVFSIAELDGIEGSLI